MMAPAHAAAHAPDRDLLADRGLGRRPEAHTLCMDMSSTRHSTLAAVFESEAGFLARWVTRDGLLLIRCLAALGKPAEARYEALTLGIGHRKLDREALVQMTHDVAFDPAELVDIDDDARCRSAALVGCQRQAAGGYVEKRRPAARAAVGEETVPARDNCIR